MATATDHGPLDRDIEMNATGTRDDLFNDVVRSFSWDAVTVTVKDRASGKPRQLVAEVDGVVRAGEMLALMGPSGSGKTTLLNVLAHRTELLRGTVESRILVNGSETNLADFRRMSGYVEQEDALVGALTVRETLYFAAQLALPRSVTKDQRIRRIDDLLVAFGLRAHADTLIGSPLRKGVSGGQKRRVSVASQLITGPRILFLDEPTSGLDSTASFEVVNYIRQIAKKHNIIVIASIHQPSTVTFQLFDKLLLLSQGRPVYNGAIDDVPRYFEEIGHPIPRYTNPAEFVLDLVNVDFAPDAAHATATLANIQRALADSRANSKNNNNATNDKQALGIGHDGTRDSSFAVSASSPPLATGSPKSAGALTVFTALVHRSFIKSYRDIVAYWIRLGMYLGLAIMMGTVWLRLHTVQADIQPYINAIFFGGAFKSFMAVAYIPAFLEDRTLFIKERSNGLYGPLAFQLANFATGVPFLFLISLLFSVVSYWLSNFRPTADGFWMWVLYLFLDLLAAESLVVLVASLAPIFVLALAVTAFANGLWMSVGGFLVPLTRLNVFWKYVFSYIDYQRWVFQGMMVNEFATRTYDCDRLADGSCQCMYPSDLSEQCKIAGTGVLDVYGYKPGQHGKYIGIIIGIVAGYRLFGLAALYIKRT